MSEILSLNEAAETMREAMRQVIRQFWLFYFTQGVLMGMTGLVALMVPFFPTSGVVPMLGWMLVVSGVFQSIILIRVIKVPHFWLQLISVALSIVIGALFIGYTGGDLLPLTLLMVVFFMIGGIARIIFALTIRPFRNWGWVLGSGVVGILLAAFLWSSAPIAAAWLLGILVGIQLLTEGAALAYMARNSVAPRTE